MRPAITPNLRHAATLAEAWEPTLKDNLRQRLLTQTELPPGIPLLEFHRAAHDHITVEWMAQLSVSGWVAARTLRFPQFYEAVGRRVMDVLSERVFNASERMHERVRTEGVEFSPIAAAVAFNEEFGELLDQIWAESANWDVSATRV